MRRSSGWWTCHTCGEKFPAGSKFCRNCGKKFGGHNEIAYKGEVSMNEERYRFWTAYRCSNCNSVMEWDMEKPKYCESCGGKISEIVEIEREPFSEEWLHNHPLFNGNKETTPKGESE